MLNAERRQEVRENSDNEFAREPTEGQILCLTPSNPCFWVPSACDEHALAQ